MTAREDFRAAVREAATYAADEGTQGWLLTEAQFAAIDTAGERISSAAWSAAWDEGRRHALRSLAADLDAESRYPGQHVAVCAAFRRAARMARKRAREAPGGTTGSGLVSSGSPSPDVSAQGVSGAADTCMEAGPQ